MDLVAYLRSASSGEEGRRATEMQEEQIRAWCAEHGHTVAAIFGDQGPAGLGLGRALVAVDFAEGLVVARLDRLGRSTVDQEVILSQVWRHDASVFAVDTGEALRDDPDDPMRTAMRQLVQRAEHFRELTQRARGSA